MNKKQTTHTHDSDPDEAGFDALRREAEEEGTPQDGPLSDKAMSEIRRRAAGGKDSSED